MQGLNLDFRTLRKETKALMYFGLMIKHIVDSTT